MTAFLKVIDKRRVNVLFAVMMSMLLCLSFYFYGLNNALDNIDYKYDSYTESTIDNIEYNQHVDAMQAKASNQGITTITKGNSILHNRWVRINYFKIYKIILKIAILPLAYMNICIFAYNKRKQIIRKILSVIRSKDGKKSSLLFMNTTF